MRSKCLAVCFLAASLVSTKATVIYRETFGIAPGATVDQQPTVFDWARFDNQGQPITASGSASGVNYTVNGRPIDVSNVNAGPNNDGTFGPYANGILYFAATPTPSLGITTEYTVDPANYVPGSIVFSWYIGNNTAPQSFRLVVRVAGTWYANTNVLSSAAVALANFGTAAEFKSVMFNPAAANWRTISFDGDYVMGEVPGFGFAVGNTVQPLALGAAPAADLSGPITGFGLYGESGGGTGNRRIDTFTIEATPLVVATAKNLIWKGSVSSDWDLNTANWITNTANATTFTFSDGDNVRFDDSAGTGFVNLVPSLLPKSVIVSNETTVFNFTGGGGINGNATFIKRGSGSLTFVNGNNNFSGGITIEDGQVIVGENGSLGSIGSGNITNNARLYISRGNTLVLSNSISGTGQLSKTATGILVLAGSNSYSGRTFVVDGTLVLNGINSGGGYISNLFSGILSGNGTNAGPVFIGGETQPDLTSGTLSPGDGIGTLTIGALTLAPQSTNIFDIGTANTVGSGINDLLVVNGDLNLNSSRLVLNVPDLPLTGVPYRLISYTGSRTGTFNTNIIINGINRYTPTISYNDTNKTVNLTFTPPASPSLVIYRETFGIAPGATVDAFANAFDWQRFDANGLVISTTGSSSGVNFTVAGRTTNAFNVNAGLNNDGTYGAYINGVLYLAATPSPSLALTSEFTVDPTNYVPGSIIFSWYEGNNTAAHIFRLMVRVGGVWYATDATFTTPAVSLANFGTQAQLKTFTYSPVATNWWQVNFDGDYVPGPTPGTGTTNNSTLGPAFLVGPPTLDLSGAITGFGFYSENGGTGTGNRRVDTFTIEAAPLGTVAQPRISSARLAEGAVVLSITNGPPNWTLRLLTSTNIAAARDTWTGVQTATFGSTGAVTLTNSYGTNSPQRFYLIQSP